MSENADITITKNQTLELTYHIENTTKNNLPKSNEIEFVENENYNEIPDDELKYSNNLLWTPDTEGTYKLKIGNKELSIQVTDIPESVVTHYIFIERSDDTIVDNAGDNDATSVGTTNVSNSWLEGWVEEGDGTDDRIDTWTWDPITTDLTGTWGIAFTIQTTDSGSIFGIEDNTPNYSFNCFTDGGFDSSTGDGLGLIIRDGTGGSSYTSLETDADIRDGSKYRCVINKESEGSDADDFALYLNTNEDTVYNRSSWNGSDGQLTRPIPLLARDNENTIVDHLDAIIDDFQLNSEPYTSDEIQNDYDSQPWS